MKHVTPYSVFEASAAAPAALTPEQVEWLNQCTEDTWKLNPQTGEVDVDGRFDCSEQGLSEFKGVRFGVVRGCFNCEKNLLTSLVGAPREVRGSFWCRDNQLTSLVGAPEKVGEDFDCGSNRLTSLEGAPQEVGSFYCYNNLLTSLVGAPREVGGVFSCDDNHLKSLVGSPQNVKSSFYCENNHLTSLVGAPQEVGWNFACGNNLLTSLEGAPRKVGYYFWCDDNPVSEKTLKSIFSRMNGGVSYLKVVESLWPKIPLEDQVLLYRPEFKWVGAEEAKKLQAVGRFNKIKGML